MLPAVLLAGALIGASGIGGVLLVPVLTRSAKCRCRRRSPQPRSPSRCRRWWRCGPLRRERALAARCLPLLAGALAGAAAGACWCTGCPPRLLMAGVTALVLFSGWRGLQSPRRGAIERQPRRMAAPLVGARRGRSGSGSALTGTGGPVLVLPLLLLLRPAGAASPWSRRRPIQLPGGAGQQHRARARAGRLDLPLAALCGVLMLAGVDRRPARRGGPATIRQLQRLVVGAAAGRRRTWFVWLLLA